MPTSHPFWQIEWHAKRVNLTQAHVTYFTRAEPDLC
jgi:hypothetical protein